MTFNTRGKAIYHNTLRGTITYPTWGKGKSCSIVPWERDMLVARSVDVTTVIVVDDHAWVSCTLL